MNHVLIKQELQSCLQYFEQNNLSEYANKIKRVLNMFNHQINENISKKSMLSKEGYIDCQGIHINSDKGKIS